MILVFKKLDNGFKRLCIAFSNVAKTNSGFMVEQGSFFNKVYEVVKQIPCGKVASYGWVAKVCGNSRMSRQVGWALHCNPQPFSIPCHRVVTKRGQLASGFAFGGQSVQRELLQSEGVVFCGDLVDMSLCSVDI